MNKPPCNPEYLKFSHVFMALAHFELSALAGEVASGYPLKIVHGTDAKFDSLQSFYLFRLYSQAYDDSLYFLIDETFGKNLVGIIKERNTIQNYSKSKPEDVAILEELGHRIFKKGFRLCSLFLGKNMLLDTVQVSKTNSSQEYETMNTMIPWKRCFVVAHHLEIGGKIATAPFQLLPKQLLREGIQNLRNSDDGPQNNKTEIDEETINEFRSVYTNLQVPVYRQSVPEKEEEMEDNEAEENNPDKMSDNATAIQEKLFIESLHNLDAILNKNNSDTSDDDITIGNPSDFPIVSIFASQLAVRQLESLFQAEVTLEPLALSSFLISQIHKEPSGMLTNVAYNMPINDKTWFIFNPEDTRRIVRGNIQSFEQVLDALLRPSSAILSVLTGKKVSILRMDNKFMNFSTVRVEREELTLRIDYRMQIKSRPDILFRQYIPVSFVNQLLICIFGEDRLIDILASKRNLLLAVLDLNREIHSKAIQNESLRSTLAIKTEDTGIEFEDDTVDFESGSENEEADFIIDPTDWQTLNERDFRIFMQEIVKLKDGKKLLAQALWQKPPALIKKVSDNVSAIVAEDIIHILKQSSINIGNQSVASSMITKFLMNLATSNQIQLSKKLSSLIRTERMRKDQQDEFEIGVVLNGDEFMTTMSKLTDSEMQRIMRIVTYKELLFAYTFAESSAQRRLKTNMTPNARKQLEEDSAVIAYYEPEERTRQKKAVLAIKKIIRAANDLTQNDVARILGDYYDMGVYYYDNRELTLAVEQCEKGIALAREKEAELPFYLLVLPAFIWSIRDTFVEKAERYLNEALELAKSDRQKSFVHAHLAVNSLTKNLPMEAKRHALKCKELYPKWSWLPDLLKDTELRCKDSPGN